MSSRVAIATVLSLATALFYAISNVLELLEAEQVPDELAMRPGLLLRLMKRPRWLLGLLSDFGGYICHAAALGLAKRLVRLARRIGQRGSAGDRCDEQRRKKGSNQGHNATLR